jgi:hypothetical protein
MDPTSNFPDERVEPNRLTFPIPFMEATPEGVHVRVGGKRIHLEYVLLGCIAALAVVIAAVAIILASAPKTSRRWGIQACS